LFDCSWQSSETVDLFYEEMGRPENPPLLILHGFFAASRNWRQMAKKLAGNYHVFVPDLRNHGASPHADRMDYQLMAADILAFIDRHGLQQVSLLGHSMGGKIAMWFSLNCPGRVKELVIVDIAPVSYTHSFNSIIKALQTLPLQAIHNRKQAEAHLLKVLHEQSFAQFLLQNLQLKDGRYSWRIDLEVFQRCADAIIAFPDTAQSQPFSGSVLLLAGGCSQHVKPAYYADIYRLFPACHINIIEASGHWLHVERPVEFLREVQNFLTKKAK